MPPSTDEISAQLNQIVGKLDERGRLIDDYTQFKAETNMQLARVVKLLDGNGKAPLTERVAQVEAGQRQIRKDLEKLQSSADKATWYALTTMITLLLSLGLMAFKTLMP